MLSFPLLTGNILIHHPAFGNQDGSRISRSAGEACEADRSARDLAAKNMQLVRALYDWGILRNDRIRIAGVEIGSWMRYRHI